MLTINNTIDEPRVAVIQQQIDGRNVLITRQ